VTGRSLKINIDWRRYGLIIALAVLSIIITILTGGIFFTTRNLINLTRQVSVNGILAVGMTFVILIAGIDLSVGSVVAATGITVAYLQVVLGWPVSASVIAALLAGLLMGAFNGFFVAKFNIHPFVITLGMMTIARGIALIISKGASIAPMRPEFAIIGSGNIPPLTSIIIITVCLCVWLFYAIRDISKKGVTINQWLTLAIGIALCALLGWVVSGDGIPIMTGIFALIAACGIFVLSKTCFGRYLYAIGGNPVAARLSGINVKLITFIVFIIMGLLSGVAGIVLTARLNAGTPTMGMMFELDAIASVVIGGTSLMGGYGSVGGSIIGAFIIGILNNGLSLLNVDPFLQYVFKGFIIIAAVMLDRRNK